MTINLATQRAEHFGFTSVDLGEAECFATGSDNACDRFVPMLNESVNTEFTYARSYVPTV